MLRRREERKDGCTEVYQGPPRHTMNIRAGDARCSFAKKKIGLEKRESPRVGSPSLSSSMDSGRQMYFTDTVKNPEASLSCFLSQTLTQTNYSLDGSSKFWPFAPPAKPSQTMLRIPEASMCSCPTPSRKLECPTLRLNWQIFDSETNTTDIVFLS